MKTIKTILFTLMALVSVQLANAQCNGSLSVSGTTPTFTFTSTNAAGAWMNYSWDFGDGTYAYTSQTATHTYNQNGVYSVVCFFSDSIANCFDTDTISVTVTGAAQNCSANFVISGNGPTFYFTPVNTPSSPIGYYNFVWDYGDGTAGVTSTMSAASHTYTTNGTYTISCILYDSIFCTDTVSAVITITNVQSCDASFTSVDSNGLFAFTPSFPASGLLYSWDFGDGTTSSSSNPIHQYSPTVTSWFNACLTVTNQTTGCIDTYCDSIFVNVGSAMCDASFTYTGSGAYYYCYASSPMPGATYSWLVSNGMTYGTQNPFMNFNTSGSYTVCLTITDAAGTCTATSCDTIVVSIPLNYNIDGYVQMGNNSADAGFVYLIEYDSILGTLTAVDTTHIDSGGSYIFYNTNPGSYLIKAALSPASSSYLSYLPTYYAPSAIGNIGGELLWSNGGYASSPSSNMYYAIDLVAGTNPGGAGFVGGLVSQGANKVGDPIGNIQIMVTDVSGNPVAYGYSDASGSFNIGNLPYGDYILYPEVYGKSTTPMNFTLSATNPGADNFLVAVNSTSAVVSIATGIQTISEFAHVKLFPNPVQNELNIDFGAMTSTEVTIEVIDITGRQVSVLDINNTNSARISTSNLNTGTYLLKLTNSEGTQIFRFVK